MLFYSSIGVAHAVIGTAGSTRLGIRTKKKAKKTMRYVTSKDTLQAGQKDDALRYKSLHLSSQMRFTGGYSTTGVQVMSEWGKSLMYRTTIRRYTHVDRVYR